MPLAALQVAFSILFHPVPPYLSAFSILCSVINQFVFDGGLNRWSAEIIQPERFTIAGRPCGRKRSALITPSQVTRLKQIRARYLMARQAVTAHLRSD
jgi:hypothetical protein